MSKEMKITMITLLSVIILALSFGAGYAVAARTDPATSPGLDVVVEVWDVIFDDYVERDKLDPGKLSQAAIKGMVAALDDPYTSYLSADMAQLSLRNLEGKFSGIGATVALQDEQLTIIAPIAGSPAAKAGIRAGDMILEIDGRSASEMTLAEAVLNIRGPKGTSVTLLVQHQGEDEPEEIAIVRAEIKLASVNFEMKGNIAYVNITHFSQRTDAELSEVLPSIVQQGAKGIILDLRNNPGGLLEAVVDAASYFLPEGLVTSVTDNEGKLKAHKVKPKEIVTDLPLVVLVNNFSASGSEVLAGALRDNSRATIAGSRTFGKGSVNIVRRLKDNSGLSITVARWLTPNGHLIEGKGLTPDYELEPDGEAAIEWAIDYLKGQERG